MSGKDGIVLLVAYLLGAIPFSYIITRWRTGLNIRQVGEGNVGGRNVAHVVGMKWGALAAILDALKGLAAYLLARALDVPPLVLLLCGFAAMIGHDFSIFLHWQGGKGVAVSLGFLLGLLPYSTLVGLGVLGVAHLLMRDFNRSVVVGIAAVIFLPLAFGYGPWMTAYALILFVSLSVKKAIDLPHERRVWAEHGWQGTTARPGWYKEENEDRPAPAGLH
jgi:glycerol-3-phosphate acyltransferase PlsY